MNQAHCCKSVTIYNARNEFHVIVNLDDFNLSERATANSQQFPTAFRGIIILYAAANSRGSHARRREADAWNDIIISLSSSKRAGAATSRRTPQTCLSRHYHTYSACHHYVTHICTSKSHFGARHATGFRFSKCRGIRNWFRNGSLTDSPVRHTHAFILEDANEIIRRHYPYHVPARSYRDRRGEFKKQLAHAA